MVDCNGEGNSMAYGITVKLTEKVADKTVSECDSRRYNLLNLHLPSSRYGVSH
jgi:hypothetical protein